MTFDLQNDGYKPYRKPDNLPVFIQSHLNHPPTILNGLPKNIAKRLIDLSSSENIFHDAIPVHKEPLRKSGFTSDLVNTPKQTNWNNNNEENKKLLYSSILHFPRVFKALLVKQSSI